MWEAHSRAAILFQSAVLTLVIAARHVRRSTVGGSAPPNMVSNLKIGSIPLITRGLITLFHVSIKGRDYNLFSCLSCVS